MKTTIDNFSAENHGASGILCALRDIAAGKQETASFVLQVHPANADGDDSELRRVVIGRCAIESPDRMAWRYCGEGGAPDGAGSHSLVPSWCQDQSAEYAACELVFALATTAERLAYVADKPVRIFRVLA